jgi:hypothetical protein
MASEVSLRHEVEAWYLALCKSDPETADLIEDAIDQLAAEGPALGRPLADRVKEAGGLTASEPRTGTPRMREWQRIRLASAGYRAQRLTGGAVRR